MAPSSTLMGFTRAKLVQPMCVCAYAVKEIGSVNVHACHLYTLQKSALMNKSHQKTGNYLFYAFFKIFFLYGPEMILMKTKYI
jgi:hypothetical protein